MLLVEDNEGNVIVARAMLEKWGCLAMVAVNGEEALRWTETADTTFEVVLMDLQMPAMGGWQATACMRRRRSEAELRIVALAATALPHERQECLDLG